MIRKLLIENSDTKIKKISDIANFNSVVHTNLLTHLITYTRKFATITLSAINVTVR